MSKLVEYVMKHAQREACCCGKCIDAPENPEEHQPTGEEDTPVPRALRGDNIDTVDHTADVGFFKVAAIDHPDPQELRQLIEANKGEFCEVNLFDGKDHSYMEIGGWIGDQGLALTLMGLGKVLGLWELLTPEILGITKGNPLYDQMIGSGFLSIMAKKAA